MAFREQRQGARPRTVSKTSSSSASCCWRSIACASTAGRGNTSLSRLPVPFSCTSPRIKLDWKALLQSQDKRIGSLALLIPGCAYVQTQVLQLLLYDTVAEVIHNTCFDIGKHHHTRRFLHELV